MKKNKDEKDEKKRRKLFFGLASGIGLFAGLGFVSAALIATSYSKPALDVVSIQPERYNLDANNASTTINTSLNGKPSDIVQLAVSGEGKNFVTLTGHTLSLNKNYDNVATSVIVTASYNNAISQNVTIELTKITNEINIVPRIDTLSVDNPSTVIDTTLNGTPSDKVSLILSGVGKSLVTLTGDTLTLKDGNVAQDTSVTVTASYQYANSKSVEIKLVKVVDEIEVTSNSSALSVDNPSTVINTTLNGVSSDAVQLVVSGTGKSFVKLEGHTLSLKEGYDNLDDTNVTINASYQYADSKSVEIKLVKAVNEIKVTSNDNTLSVDNPSTGINTTLNGAPSNKVSLALSGTGESFVLLVGHNLLLKPNYNSQDDTNVIITASYQRADSQTITIRLLKVIPKKLNISVSNPVVTIGDGTTVTGTLTTQGSIINEYRLSDNCKNVFTNLQVDGNKFTCSFLDTITTSGNYDLSITSSDGVVSNSASITLKGDPIIQSIDISLDHSEVWSGLPQISGALTVNYSSDVPKGYSPNNLEFEIAPSSKSWFYDFHMTGSNTFICTASRSNRGYGVLNNTLQVSTGLGWDHALSIVCDGVTSNAAMLHMYDNPNW